tara:strand:+ start:436 stop:1566 length:1131 start_codon:yes stop_codon:yes gene_type:complete
MVEQIFMGKDGFHWFIGVVEDRNDPLQVGRVRVRAVGYHTENKTILPTEDLPWATVMTSTESSGMSGLGTTPHFLVLGTHIVGFFRDVDCQEPVILGALPGAPGQYGNPNVGFADPTRRSEDTSEVDYNRSYYPKTPEESDINELARGVLTATNPNFREGTRHVDVAAAGRDQFTVSTVNEDLTIDAVTFNTFSEPRVANSDNTISGTYKPTYPLNHVYETETGHLLEFDDTPDHARINIFHNSGTYMELSKNGTRVNHTAGDEHNTALNRFTNIKDNETLTVNGSMKILVNTDRIEGQNFDIQIDDGANLNIQVDRGAANIVVKGNVNLKADGDLNANAANISLNSEGKFNMIAGSDIKISGASVDIDGTPIDLN